MCACVCVCVCVCVHGACCGANMLSSRRCCSMQKKPSMIRNPRAQHSMTWFLDFSTRGAPRLQQSNFVLRVVFMTWQNPAKCRTPDKFVPPAVATDSLMQSRFHEHPA